MNYRNKKLTQSAKHEACVSCGANDGTIVWAHSNNSRHGKGMGIKAHDIFGAYLCANCHKRYDAHENLGIQLSRGGYLFCNKAWFIEQWEKSIIIACKKGYL